MSKLRAGIELLCIAALLAFAVIGAPLLLTWYAVFPPRMDVRHRRGGGFEHP